MYLPPHFEETDPSQIYDLIDKFSLAVLVAQTEQGLVANHIPLMLQDKQELLGQLALKTTYINLFPLVRKFSQSFVERMPTFHQTGIPQSLFITGMYRPGTIRLYTFMERSITKMTKNPSWLLLGN